MKFKTKPFKHQRKVFKLSVYKEYFALLMEQGTGKSWVIVNTAAQLWLDHLIDTLVILAPKGIAPEWVRVQVPDHMPDEVRWVAALWKAPSRMTRALEKQIKTVLSDDTGALRILVMNLEAFGSTTDALDFVIGVLDDAQSAMVAVDESHRIKSHDAHVTKRILNNVKPRSAYRRILTGTVADKPFDVYPQFNFLHESILDVPSFTAFKAEYAELMPQSAGLMRHILRRVPKKWDGNYVDSITGQVTESARDADGLPNKKNMVPSYVPQLVARNADGTPRYRNLDKLQELIAPHSFRVLKTECLDLPPKVYTRYHTELEDRQRRLYDQLKEQQRIEWEDGHLTVVNRLTALLRLQQIVCGYLPDEGRMVELFPDWKRNPRIVSSLEFIEDRPPSEHIIIWCRFIEDIRRLTEALAESYGSNQVVHFYGDVKDKQREENVARFEGERRIMKDGRVIRVEPVPDSDRARFMLAQQRAGGIGQTWISATLSYTYSNAFSLIDRLQAEDRPHRIGQKRSVQYTDIEADDTVDGSIITTLVAKKEIADVIQGDEGLTWLR